MSRSSSPTLSSSSTISISGALVEHRYGSLSDERNPCLDRIEDPIAPHGVATPDNLLALIAPTFIFTVLREGRSFPRSHESKRVLIGAPTGPRLRNLGKVDRDISCWTGSLVKAPAPGHLPWSGQEARLSKKLVPDGRVHIPKEYRARAHATFPSRWTATNRLRLATLRAQMRANSRSETPVLRRRPLSQTRITHRKAVVYMSDEEGNDADDLEWILENSPQTPTIMLSNSHTTTPLSILAEFPVPPIHSALADRRGCLLAPLSLLSSREILSGDGLLGPYPDLPTPFRTDTPPFSPDGNPSTPTSELSYDNQAIGVVPEARHMATALRSKCTGFDSERPVSPLSCIPSDGSISTRSTWSLEMPSASSSVEDGLDRALERTFATLNPDPSSEDWLIADSEPLLETFNESLKSMGLPLLPQDHLEPDADKTLVASPPATKLLLKGTETISSPVSTVTSPSPNRASKLPQRSGLPKPAPSKLRPPAKAIPSTRVAKAHSIPVSSATAIPSRTSSLPPLPTQARTSSRPAPGPPPTVPPPSAPSTPARIPTPIFRGRTTPIMHPRIPVPKVHTATIVKRVRAMTTPAPTMRTSQPRTSAPTAAPLPIQTPTSPPLPSVSIANSTDALRASLLIATPSAPVRGILKSPKIVRFDCDDSPDNSIDGLGSPLDTIPESIASILDESDPPAIPTAPPSAKRTSAEAPVSSIPSLANATPSSSAPSSSVRLSASFVSLRSIAKLVSSTSGMGPGEDTTNTTGATVTRTPTTSGIQKFRGLPQRLRSASAPRPEPLVITHSHNPTLHEVQDGGDANTGGDGTDGELMERVKRVVDAETREGKEAGRIVMGPVRLRRLSRVTEETQAQMQSWASAVGSIMTGGTSGNVADLRAGAGPKAGPGDEVASRLRTAQANKENEVPAFATLRGRLSRRRSGAVSAFADASAAANGGRAMDDIGIGLDSSKLSNISTSKPLPPPPSNTSTTKSGKGGFKGIFTRFKS